MSHLKRHIVPEWALEKVELFVNENKKIHGLL
jgi:hypothetical protein